MSKTTERDNFFAYAAATVVVCLAVIFFFTWSQTRAHTRTVEPEVSYAPFGPFQIETQKLSISASLAVQTSRADASWPNSNREILNTVFKHVLESTDPNVLKSPKGLQQLQDALTKGCDDELHTDMVQAVLLTDFVAQSRDS